MEKYLKEFDKRFTIIFPIIKEFRQSTAKPDTSTSDSLHFKLQGLSKKVAALEQSAWQHIHITSSPTSVTQSVTMDSDIKDIRHQMKILQHRIVGGGVKIGSKVFQSFEDVQVWVKSELPTRRYGLFVDAVSILDFFSCLGHIDAENQGPLSIMRTKQALLPSMNPVLLLQFKIFSRKFLVKEIHINISLPSAILINGTMGPTAWSTKLLGA